MMRLRSFRLRLLAGSILWTMGLLFVAHMLSLVLMHHFDNDRIVHVIYRKGHIDLAETGRSRLTKAELQERIVESRRRTYVRGGAFAIVAMAAGLWLVRGGLKSLRELRGRLGEVREGRLPRVEGEYPNEVQPLVNDLNGLLEQRELQVARAQAKAGDLAHGLKTPLALLAQEAERAEASGQLEIAASIAEQVERMRRQIDYHLANARAAASGSVAGSVSRVRVSVEGIVRALQKLHAGRQIEFAVEVDPEHAARVERLDLDEMLGNLLENASHWARTRVVISSSLRSGSIAIDVDDDGPGLGTAMREAVLRRGVRADQAAAGSGLGLAIVRDLAELYRGSISLDDSRLGGLRARLELPAP